MRSWSLFEGSRRGEDDARAATDVEPSKPETVSEEAVPPAVTCPLLPGLEDDVFLMLSDIYAESDELETTEVMRKRNSAYLDVVRAAFHQNEYLDIELVENLGDLADALLVAAEEMSIDERRLAHAGVVYFVRSDDVNDDLADRTGFGDDLDVLSAVTRYLGREDLIPKHL
jgi:hypothetical protein